MRFLAFLLLLLTTQLFAKTEFIRYSHFGNYKAILSVPDKVQLSSKKLPVVIYSYDEYYDWAGKRLAKQNGYDLENITKAFSNRGYICITPLERYRKLRALTGAVNYAKSIPQADLKRISFVGISEGGFLALLTMKQVPDIDKMVIISPAVINYTGHFSFPELMRQERYFKKPEFLLLSAANETKWRTKSAESVVKLLENNAPHLEQLSYYADKRWFWNPQNKYMNDIDAFLSSRSYN